MVAPHEVSENLPIENGNVHAADPAELIGSNPAALIVRGLNRLTSTM